TRWQVGACESASRRAEPSATRDSAKSFRVVLHLLTGGTDLAVETRTDPVHERELCGFGCWMPQEHPDRSRIISCRIVGERFQAAEMDRRARDAELAENRIPVRIRVSECGNLQAFGVTAGLHALDEAVEDCRVAVVRVAIGIPDFCE